MQDSADATENHILAVVSGTPLTDVPDDLFIPPDALELLLDTFNGPMDLLLYLIRKQNIDILDIPMTQITRQYMSYISLMEKQRLELAADYMAMAAVLIEIKSRMLLPSRADENTDEIEEDPRMALVRRLQLYEQFQKASDWLDDLPRCDRDFYAVSLSHDHLDFAKPHPQVEIKDLVLAMQGLVEKAGHLVSHEISREPLSVRERMNMVLEKLQQNNGVDFGMLYQQKELEMGVIVSFLAVLELAKQSLLSITQTRPFGNIRLMAIKDE